MVDKFEIMAQSLHEYYCILMSQWVSCIPQKKNDDCKLIEKEYVAELQKTFGEKIKRWDELNEGQKDHFRLWAHKFYKTHPWPYDTEL